MAARAKKGGDSVKLDVYTWMGTDKKGHRIKGESTSSSAAAVKADLRRQGITPITVKKKPKSLFSGKRKAKITPGDIAVFARQLATMMTAGVPLVQAFDIIGQGNENPSMADLILAIKADVEGGTTLAEALAKRPLHFDDLFVNLVRAGEQAGVLESLLNKIATYKEKTEALKGKIKKALFYPVSVLVVAFIVTAILLIFVIPQFEELFKGFGADLPAFTQFVVNLSRAFTEWWWAIFGGIGLVITVLLDLNKRSPAFRRGRDRILLKMPIIGLILNKAAVARFARTMSTMFAAGVPLVEAMESVAGATGNVVYSDAVMEMRENVATGQQLQLAMKQTNLFPSMVIQMVAIGEESGSLDNMLGKVADFYEEEVDNLVDSMSSLMEPLIMAVLGVLIGGLIVAMYLPIFKLGAVV